MFGVPVNLNVSFAEPPRRLGIWLNAVVVPPVGVTEPLLVPLMVQVFATLWPVRVELPALVPTRLSIEVKLSSLPPVCATPACVPVPAPLPLSTKVADDSEA